MTNSDLIIAGNIKEKEFQNFVCVFKLCGCDFYLFEKPERVLENVTISGSNMHLRFMSIG